MPKNLNSKRYFSTAFFLLLHTSSEPLNCSMFVGYFFPFIFHSRASQSARTLFHKLTLKFLPRRARHFISAIMATTFICPRKTYITEWQIPFLFHFWPLPTQPRTNSLICLRVRAINWLAQIPLPRGNCVSIPTPLAKILCNLAQISTSLL